MSRLPALVRYRLAELGSKSAVPTSEPVTKTLPELSLATAFDSASTEPTPTTPTGSANWTVRAGIHRASSASRVGRPRRDRRSFRDHKPPPDRDRRLSP